MSKTERKLETELARERTSRYAPPPVLEPIVGGVLGAALVFVCIEIFAVIGGLDIARFQVAMLISMAIGFAAPFILSKLQEHKHFAAFLRELDCPSEND